MRRPCAVTPCPRKEQNGPGRDAKERLATGAAARAGALSRREPYQTAPRVYSGSRMLAAGPLPTPWSVTRAIAAPENLMPDAHPAAPVLLSLRTPALPRRTISVVPHPVTIQPLNPSSAMIEIALDTLKVRTAQRRRLFPLLDISQGQERHPGGVLSVIDGADPTYAFRFSLGFDGSFGQSEFIRESVHASGPAGRGVGLFTCLDRFVGALVASREFLKVHSARGCSWIVLSLEGVAGQRLTFDFADRSILGVHLHDWKLDAPTIHVGGTFQPELDDNQVIAFATAIGAEIGYYAGFPFNEEMVSKEVGRMLTRVSPAQRRETRESVPNGPGPRLPAVNARKRRPKKPWSERWETLRDLFTGGSGTTKVVRERHSGGDTTERVLKILNRPADPDRRGRMKREVHALRSLEVEGVPRLVDANEDATDGELLYIVTAFVPGPRLEDRVKEGLFTLDDALDLVEALLGIVEQVHAAGIVHRDIKPDNIILRDGNHRTPSLVDFGLAAADGQEMTTKTEHQVGNRFLGLPELHTPHDDKRDPRSDITYCCGVLFYALTGCQPMTLLDGSNRPPHRRPQVDPAFGEIEHTRLLALTELFNTGFAYGVADRFQTADEFRMALSLVRSPHHPPERAQPAVQSLWTISATKGTPRDLCFQHRLLENSGQIVDHFEGKLSPIAIAALPEAVQQAINVLWAEVVARQEISRRLPYDAPFKRAFDYIGHVLDSEWAAAGVPVTKIAWGREIQRPTMNERGPRASIAISDLTPAGRAAVATLDREARTSGHETYREAELALEEWDKEE